MQKFKKKPREIQKNKKTKLQTLTHQLVPTWVLQFCFFVFFWFYLEKSKNNQKTKIADPNSPACTYMGLPILFFLFFWFYLEKSKKNKKKQNCKTYVGTSWWVRVCNFVFFCVFVFFGFTSRNPKKTKKQKNKIARPMSVQAGELGSAILFFLLFFVFFVFCFFGFTSRNPKKNKKNKIARPMSVQADELGSAILFFLFFLVFSRFLWILPKTTTNNKKNKLHMCVSGSATYVVSKRNRNMRMSFFW